MSSDRHQTHRYVVRPETTWEDVDRFARALGWPLVRTIYQDREEGVDGQVIWQALDVAALHYIEDAISSIGYIVVTGQQERTAEAVAEQAAEALNAWSLDELFEAFDGVSDARSRAQMALRIGLAAPPEFNEGVLSRITKVLSDSDPRVRIAGLWATTYAVYPEFVSAVRKIAEDEKVDWVRERAKGILKAFETEDET